MDPITHALSGALLARAAAASPSSQQHPEQTDLPLRLQVIAGFIAAAFPDVDLVLRLIDTLTYLNWHQGPTHSLILMPLWAWLLACLFSRLSRKRHDWPKVRGDSSAAVFHCFSANLDGILCWQQRYKPA